VIEQGAARDPFGDKRNAEGLLIAQKNSPPGLGRKRSGKLFRRLLLVEDERMQPLLVTLERPLGRVALRSCEVSEIGKTGGRARDYRIHESKVRPLSGPPPPRGRMV
jgi:hypothetical protein